MTAGSTPEYEYTISGQVHRIAADGWFTRDGCVVFYTGPQLSADETSVAGVDEGSIIRVAP
jgi:hypothetical protein